MSIGQSFIYLSNANFHSYIYIFQCKGGILQLCSSPKLPNKSQSNYLKAPFNVRASVFHFYFSCEIILILSISTILLVTYNCFAPFPFQLQGTSFVNFHTIKVCFLIKTNRFKSIRNIICPIYYYLKYKPEFSHYSTQHVFY